MWKIKDGFLLVISTPYIFSASFSAMNHTLQYCFQQFSVSINANLAPRPARVFPCFYNLMHFFKDKCYSMFCWSQAQNQTTGVLGAVKVIEVRSEEQLDDYTTEIDILAACRHANILSLLDAIFFEGWLWVSHICLWLFFFQLDAFFVTK